MIRIFIIIFFLCATIFSQQNEAFVIHEIEVIGNELLSDDNIKFISGLNEGLSINSFNVQSSIKKLWDTKRYLDVQIDIQKQYLNNKLIIYVEEAPFVNDIIINGNSRISDKKIMNKFIINKGDVLSFYKINESINEVKKMYKEKNYHNVSITYSLKGNDTVVLDVDEGKKVRLSRIDIDGNNKFSDKKIAKIFQNTKTWKWFMPWGHKFDKNLYLLDKKILESFYYNKGYKDFQIIEDSVIYDDEKILIHLKVDEGNQYFIRDVSWEGNTTKSDSLLTQVSNIKKGDLFNRQNFDMNVLESINSLYMDEGYLNFNIESVIKPLSSKDSLDIKFIISENQIFTINNIVISGNKKTHENVIRRELDIFPGEKFNRNKLYQSITDLWMLNFFSDVVPRVNPISDNQINLEVEVVEKSVGTANFSMGYNQIHGLQGGGGFEFPNFRGKGQNLSITYQRGLGNNYSSGQNLYQSYSTSNTTTYESFSVGFFDPSIFDTPNSFGISVSHSERGKNQNSLWPFDTKNSKISLRFGKRKLKWPDSKFRILWSYSYSLDQYLSDDREQLIEYWGRSNSDIESYIEEQNNLYVFNTSGVSISQILTRDSRNRPEYPTSGSKVNFTSTLAGGFLGGNHDYMKNSFEVNSFSSFSDKIVISQIFKAGSLRYIEDLSNSSSVVPISARYFMGGSGMSYGEMLRGYRENSIGPYQTGPTGGNLMLKYSLEFRVLFSGDPTVYGFLFADMGNVWSDYDVVKLTDLKRSAGIGFRLYMPMLGVLGYDMGYGFDSTIIDGNQKHGWEHHFVFGMPIN